MSFMLVLGPSSDLLESGSLAEEDCPFFCLSFGACLFANTLFLLDYSAVGAPQSCCAAL